MFYATEPFVPWCLAGAVACICIIYSYIKKSERDEQYRVLQSMADIYFSMHYINLIEDTAQEFTSLNPESASHNRSHGAAQLMKQIVRAVVTDEDMERALEFTDLSTIPERMKGKSSISMQLIGREVGWFLAMFIVTDSDSEGRPTKVVFTTRIIDEEKKLEEKIIRDSLVDELTGLYNRRAYENHLIQYPDVPVEPEFVYVVIDINGLKTVNDTYGHEAGDEVIRGAADCLKKSLGNRGKIFRTGGDEFVAILFSDENRLQGVLKDLDDLTLAWHGDIVPSLSLSVGYVTKNEFRDETVLELSRIADERMYLAKARYYSQKGVDRRDQSLAYKAMCNLYSKILKVNITNDTYSIVQVDASEQVKERGYSKSLSGWLTGFGEAGQIHEDDLELYQKNTELEYLREYFRSGKTSINIQYRRMYSNGFKFVSMEMIQADDYTDDNQTLFLFVKNIDA